MVCGGLLGTGAAWALTRFIGSQELFGPVFGGGPGLIRDVALVGASVAFALALTVGAAVLLLLPGTVADGLQEEAEGRGAGANPRGERASGWRAPGGLTALQMGLGGAILVVALLTARGVLQLEQMNLGFDPHGAVVFDVHPELLGYGEEGAGGLYEAVRRVSVGLPEVEGATWMSPGPFSGVRFMGRLRVGAGGGEVEERVSVRTVGPAALDVLGIPLVEGRGFGPEEGEPGAPEGSPRSVVVSQDLAEALFPGESAVGRTAHLDAREIRIVGVAAPARLDAGWGDRVPEVYRPAPAPLYNTSVIVRSRVAAEGLGPRLQEAVRSVDRDLAIVATALPARLGVSWAGVHAVSRLFAVLSGLAILSLVLGILGITMRIRREVAVVGRMVAWAALGLVPGLAAAALVFMGLDGALGGVDPFDPVAYAGAAAGLLLLSAGTAWIFVRAGGAGGGRREAR